MVNKRVKKRPVASIAAFCAKAVSKADAENPKIAAKKSGFRPILSAIKVNITAGIAPTLARVPIKTEV
jgi:hypothetical protein